MVHILSVKLNNSVNFNFLRELIGGILCVSLLFMFSNSSYAATNSLKSGESKSYVLTYPVTTYNSYLDDYGNLYSTVTLTGNINTGVGSNSSTYATSSLILNTSQGDFPVFYNDSSSNSFSAGRTLTCSGVPTGLTLYVTQYNTGTSDINVSTPSFSPSLSATVYSLDTDDIDYTSKLNNIITNQNTSNGYLNSINTVLPLIDNHIVSISGDTTAIKSTCDALLIECRNVSNGVWSLKSVVDNIDSNVLDIENLIRGDLGTGFDFVSILADSFVYQYRDTRTKPLSFFDKFAYVESSDISSNNGNIQFGSFLPGEYTVRGVPFVNCPPGDYSFYFICSTTAELNPTNFSLRGFNGTDLVISNTTRPSHSLNRFTIKGNYLNIYRFDITTTTDFDNLYFYCTPDIEYSSSNFECIYFALARHNGTITDLMDLMEKQWEGSYNVPSDTTTAITNLDGSLGSVEATEQSYYDSYDTAYNNTGIADWNLSVLATEFSFVQATVNLFYNGLPSTIRFLIVSVLVIGIFGIILSTLGRIRK